MIVWVPRWKALIIHDSGHERQIMNDENCKATEKNRPQLLVPAVVENHADKTIDQTHLD